MIYSIQSLTSSQIAKAVRGELVKGSGTETVASVSCDSRTISPDTLFIPLKGEKFDGHTFLSNVCKEGIGGYLFSNETNCDEAPFSIYVEDTSKALLDLAAYYRSLFNIPFVALTGSVGKTTTKELIASVLSQKYSTHATKGNFNNNIGVPYTLFGLNSTHEAAVIEMGMSNFGEIEALSLCATPDIAVITNIGTSHIEFLGSQEGILKAKSEIFKGLNPDGAVVLNGDDPYLLKLKGTLGERKVRYVGINNTSCDYVAKNVKTDENGCSFECCGKEYVINLAGIHNVYNALSAIAVGEMLNLSPNQIYCGLSQYHSVGIRQNIIEANGYKIINDCYNSSPQSAIAALSVLTTVKAKRKIAVLGDMAELGNRSEELHREVGKAFNQSGSDVLITVGELSKYIAAEVSGKETHSFQEAADAAEFLKTYCQKEDAVLIKGSRCMKLEIISEKLV